MGLIGSLLQLAIFLMMIAIFGSVIISWLRAFRVHVPYTNPLVRAIEDTADLMLRPIRRALPTSGGGLDFAPMVAIIVLYILQWIIARL
jgi:uncharacterized protein YggT (Ycf19 family)